MTVPSQVNYFVNPTQNPEGQFRQIALSSIYRVKQSLAGKYPLQRPPDDLSSLFRRFSSSIT
ncbi:unnamed protein product, partial [Ilex paraguariensis]